MVRIPEGYREEHQARNVTNGVTENAWPAGGLQEMSVTFSFLLQSLVVTVSSLDSPGVALLCEAEWNPTNPGENDHPGSSGGKIR